MKRLAGRWLVVTLSAAVISWALVYAGGLIFRNPGTDEPWPQTNPDIHGQVVGRTHSGDGQYLLKIHLSDDSVTTPGYLTVAVTRRDYRNCPRPRVWPDCAYR